MVAYFIGWVLKIEALLMVLPLIISLIYREEEALWILVIAAVGGAIGVLMSRKKPDDASFYTREGFVAVALSWIILSLFGALPFYLTGAIPSYSDALFETISGFTTTGASILREVEGLPMGILFWRSFTHWVGGMGVLVFILAILPLTGGDNIHIMRAESPGPSVGKFVPRVKSTAKILYGIYIGFTALEIVILCLTGMPLVESSMITFGTVGTGGFAVRNDSTVSYTIVQQAVITVFMLLCGTNFNVYFLMLAGKPQEAFKSEEVKAYYGIYAAVVILCAIGARNKFDSFALALHHSAFNVASCMTTTGFASTDYDMWPMFSKMLILLVMFIGACAGSTAGGMKVSRIVIAFKTIRKEMESLIHPRSVKIIKFEGKPIEHTVLRSTNVYFMTYFIVFAISVLLVAINGKDLTITLTSVIATLNNIGPGLGAVGPAGNFADMSMLSKYVLMFDMLAGRLELFPMLLLFSFKTWKRQW